MQTPPRSRADRRPIALATLVAAVAALEAPAQEQPPGCNAASLGAALIPTVDGAPVPAGACVIPGQAITYFASVFVDVNDPGRPEVVYCDAAGGQLAVTFPDFEDLPLRPGQFVPTAGYPTTPVTEIPPFGNPDGAGTVFTTMVPSTYIVEAAHATTGLLRARVDYGQTAYLDLIGMVQGSADVLTSPPQEGTAAITNSLKFCLPAIEVEKAADPAVVCVGVATEVLYTITVANVGDADLTDVLVVDDGCDGLAGPFGDDGDGLLETGETWQFTCTRVISTTTTNEVTATAVAIAEFPPGQAVTTVTYADTATATVTAEPCPGACCFPDGSCRSLDEDDCDSAGGIFQGVDTDCVTVECPEPTGACCLVDGSCADALTERQCAAAGGIYQGDLTTCFEVECVPPPTGACCLADGSCLEALTAAQCQAAGGTYAGDDVSCADADCAVGACCLPETSPQFPCGDTTEPRCIVLGGEFLGIGTECDDSPLLCADVPGACCFPDGTCSPLPQDECLLAGGVFLGGATACVTCPEPGACCLPTGQCVITANGNACVAQGGQYQGNGVTCGDAGCGLAAAAGCGPAYWAHPMHVGDWPPPFQPTTAFASVFANAFPGLTLGDVLLLDGASLQLAGREAVAALLNAASPQVDYGVTPTAVVTMFNLAWSGGTAAQLQLALELGGANQVGCPLNGDLPTMPIAVGDGQTPFDTFAASSGGPELPPACDEGAGLSFMNDVWRLYTAGASRDMLIDVCESDFDTRIAVYDAGGLVQVPLACADDGCGNPATHSQVTLAVEQGASYLIRIGGHGVTGSGMLRVTPSCAADVTGDLVVDVDDLVAVILAWGPCVQACPADLDGSGVVDVDDLVALLLGWGSCG